MEGISMTGEPSRREFGGFEPLPTLTPMPKTSESELGAIRAIMFDTFGTIVDWRTSLIKDIEELGDQAKANEAINRLVTARAELTRAISQFSLKVRTVLTAQQWLEMQKP